MAQESLESRATRYNKFCFTGKESAVFSSARVGLALNRVSLVSFFKLCCSATPIADDTLLGVDKLYLDGFAGTITSVLWF